MGKSRCFLICSTVYPRSARCRIAPLLAVSNIKFANAAWKKSCSAILYLHVILILLFYHRKDGFSIKNLLVCKILCNVWFSVSSVSFPTKNNKNEIYAIQKLELMAKNKIFNESWKVITAYNENRVFIFVARYEYFEQDERYVIISFYI